MPDPSTLLLLACTNCLNAPSASELPDTQCSQIQNSLAADQLDVKARPCVSSPETDQIPLHSPKSQASSLPSGLELLASPYLRLGSRGETVIQLQTQLHALGHYQGVIDGVYGPLTR
ncbi:MAG: peptidoglycan-binding protein, partial [Pseudanabaenales cyanobacterium]|nr:peptidoglycan-binding protein [Pseudanabaenales cyanobacterium]